MSYGLPADNVRQIRIGSIAVAEGSRIGVSVECFLRNCQFDPSLLKGSSQSVR